MAEQQHPITPPPELVEQLYGLPQMRAIEKAYQAGADQELEACCAWLMTNRQVLSASALGAARRPEPPSLKEQALTALTRYMTGKTILTNESVDTIRRALEALDD